MNLHDHPFIQSINAEHRESILPKVVEQQFGDGEIIFRENTPADALYLLLEGTVRFIKERPDGSRQPVSETGEGGFFGEVGLLTEKRRSLGATSSGASRIAILPKDEVKRIMDQAGPGRRLLESVIFHLENTTGHYIEQVLRTEKLALVGSMISSILHDFKNPISIISLGANVLRQKHRDDPKTVKICDNIDSQIRRMIGMANDLGAFSRGDEEIEIHHIDANKLFEDFRLLNTPFFEDGSVTIELVPNNISFPGNAGKLLRVLQNLVTNAIEAIRKTDRHGTIRIRAEEEEKEKAPVVRILVEDDGPGIPETIRETFFEPFVTEGKINGTGLGSAIAKSLVEAHNGTIDFETGPGGTRFTIRLPQKTKLPGSASPASSRSGENPMDSSRMSHR